jgi:hypothetical protein
MYGGEEIMRGTKKIPKKVQEAVNRMHGEKDAANWNISDCLVVDEYVKKSALRELRMRLVEMKIPEIVLEFVMLMARFKFGSGETDDFLKQMDCYDERLDI